MKKFLLTLLAVVLCVPVLAFAGCKNTDAHAINMERYFSEVTYKLYPKYESHDDIELKSFLDNKSDHLNRYTEITFKGVKDWLYGLEVEKVMFYIYSNETKDVQFNFKITNLKRGDPTATSPTTTLTKIVPVHLVKNTAVAVAVKDINDYFVSLTANCDFTLSIQDGASYFQDTDPETNQRVTNEFKFDILNFQVYGFHRAEI